MVSREQLNPDVHARRTRVDYAVLVTLTAILALAALLRAWDLDKAGFGTQYYAAAVLSMLDSWHNFFFNAFDPAGFVSVDKPPLALWVQVVSAKIFGFDGLSIHVPQVLEGVGTVALLYHLVRRRFGAASGLLAALFLTLTPISVAVDRSNNTDSALVLGLMAAAWALSLATELGSRRFLLVSMALLGIAFNVKMLAAIVVLPPFAAVYFFGAPLSTSRKLAHLVLGGVLLAAISLTWCVAYDLTPASSRPYAGSTKTNSMLELVVGENGIRRFVRGRSVGVPSSAAAQSASSGPASNTTSNSPDANATSQAGAAQGASNANGFPNGRNRAADGVPVGPLRLLNPLLADQMGWLYPLAFLGIVASLWRRRLRVPLDPQDASVLLWAGWAITYGAVLSFAGGIFHAYYLAAMAPPVCALAAICVQHLWRWYSEGKGRAWLLPLSFAAIAAWQIYIGHGYLEWQLSAPPRGDAPATETLGHVQHVLTIALVISAVISAAGLLLARAAKTPGARRLAWVGLSAGIFSTVLGPSVWTLGSMDANGNANSPTAQPPGVARVADAARARFGGGRADPQLVAFLIGRSSGERFFLATQSSQQAAPIILATGKAVMAIGGFAGADPILTPDSLDQLVQQKQLRFVLINGGGGGGGFAGRGGGEQKPLMDWIAQHGTVVEPALWRSSSADNATDRPAGANRRGGRTRGGNGGVPQLFDLRPDPAPTSLGDAPEPARDQ